LIIVVLAAAGLASAALAIPAAKIVQLHSQRGATATGTAIVHASGSGTAVTLDLRGLPPRRRVVALLHAGTCTRPSASVAEILTATAGASGRLLARGRIRFHGAPVSFSTVTDGPHEITIVSGASVVACGAIP
jgi:hypothetical protein